MLVQSACVGQALMTLQHGLRLQFTQPSKAPTLLKYIDHQAEYPFLG